MFTFKAILPAVALALGLFVSCGQSSEGGSSTPAVSSPAGNHLSMKLNGKEWVADHDIFGAVHPPGYNKAILIAGSKGPKDASEQAFNLNLFNTTGPGTHHIKSGNPELSVVQMGNLTPQNFMYGNTMGFDLKVTVVKADKATGEIEATFEGDLTGNAGDVLKVTEGRFFYRD